MFSIKFLLVLSETMFPNRNRNILKQFFYLYIVTLISYILSISFCQLIKIHAKLNNKKCTDALCYITSFHTAKFDHFQKKNCGKTVYRSKNIINYYMNVKHFSDHNSIHFLLTLLKDVIVVRFLK